MSATALVIGGTGPTGPHVVEGLLERGFAVTILHGGQHEADLPDEVPHIHADPHFAEPLAAALDGRSFDLVVAQYGRLKVVADVVAGRTGRVVAVGGATGSMAASHDPRWGAVGRPAIVDVEGEVLEDDIERNKFGFRMAEAERHLFARHAEGAFEATYLGYPVVYGPRQLAPHDWCVVRRILDGRRRLVIADGGLKLESRLFVHNAVHALLLAVDRPEAVAGRKFLIADEHVHAVRQRIEAIARHLGVELELVDLPFDLARPAHPLWRHAREHRVRSDRAAREVLGYRDAVAADAALRETVDWLLANRPEPGGPEEQRLGDPFDYEAEDALVEGWERAAATVPVERFEVARAAHPYRHPKAPGQGWSPPGRRGATSR